MLFASKLIVRSGNIILNICDPELVDKTIKDEERVITIGSDYYNEKTVDETEATHQLQNCTSVNMVGEKIISLSLKLGIGSDKGVRKIDGIPFLIVFKV